MAGDLLAALASMELQKDEPFTFQHRLCHDFESLIWVVVFAMMVHHRNNLAATDPERCEAYKKTMDGCWAAHAYSNLGRCHNDMMVNGCSFSPRAIVRVWFPDPPEAAFFRDAMRLVRNQTLDGDNITYEGLCALFRKHIQLGKELQAVDVVSNDT
jgi:hypothetical protein